MSHRITELFETPQHIPMVAAWIYDAFWADKGEMTVETLSRLLEDAKQSDAIPLSLLAWSGEEPAGTVNLVENDDPKREHLRPWLAALYVRPNGRRQGIGSALVSALKNRAAELRISTVYLGTDNPRFYERLGAIVHEQIDESFCVMSLDTER